MCRWKYKRSRSRERDARQTRFETRNSRFAEGRRWTCKVAASTGGDRNFARSVRGGDARGGAARSEGSAGDLPDQRGSGGRRDGSGSAGGGFVDNWRRADE